MAGRDDAGFSLAELLIASTLLLVVASMMVAALAPASAAFRVQPEAADLQQRLRTAMHLLHDDLVSAGAGFVGGASPGPLVRRLPPVLPYRLGTTRADPPAGTYFRPDTITILTVVSAAMQCASSVATLPDGPVLLASGPGCPTGDPTCGFTAGTRAVIVDDRGAWDPFTVTAVDAGAGVLQHAEDRLSATYAAGASVAAIRMRTYYWRDDPSGVAPALMRYDGYRSDLPVLDHVVRFQIEYFGEPAPPVLDESDPAAVRTTYGPPPPPVGVDDEADAWPPGENCLFAVLASAHTPRLPALAADSDGLARLDPVRFLDGPWCPDPAASNRYDADLLRIRRVRLTVRVQAANIANRGPAGPLFARPGAARDAGALLPDQELRLDVSPRSLRPGG